MAVVHGALRGIETQAKCIKAGVYSPFRMSIRSNPRPSQGQTPSSAIDFRDEFVASSTNAALAASQEETVSHILQRLDQLQSTIANAPEATAPAPVARTIRKAESGDLHSRLSALENINEDHLRRLGAKLDGLERQFSNNKEAEALMGRIATKFTAIESQLNANKDVDGLMNKIATKFSQVESKLQSATQLHDRVSELESKAQLHARLHDRISTLESRIKPDIHSRIAQLEARLEPDPEQERILSRINSKLEILEQSARKQKTVSLGADFDRPRSSMDRARPSEDMSLGSNAEREERINFLQTRIEKLKELRSRYEMDESQ